MRKGALILWLLILFGGIIAFFWYSALVYSLPTPVPAEYKYIGKGEHVDIQKGLRRNKKLPLFLHFFNPDCPCSKFNVPQIRTLIKEYKNQVDFSIVVVSAAREYSIKDIQEKFHAEVPVSFDTSIAKTCGVYSTPQAVILDVQDKLFYRGNYNRSRYCTDKKTEYAKIALDSLLHENTSPVFDQLALKAYGCQLPTCTKP